LVCCALLAAAMLVPSAVRADDAVKPAPAPIRQAAPLPTTNGTCAYSPLTSGVTQTTALEANFSFTQANVYWTAVGLRGRLADNWDLAVYDSAGTEAGCVSDSIAGSNRPAGSVDVIVGDFNHNTLATYYARAYPVAAAELARIEWDDGPDLIAVNGYPTLRTTSRDDVLECFDVRLFAGTTYSFTIASTGLAKMRLYAFRNPAAAPYWVPLDSAQVAVIATPEGALANFTAPETDWYGVVVVNESDDVGSYRVEVNTCFNVSVLVPGVPQSANNSPTPFKFTQVDRFWTAVGERGSSEFQPWEISLWQGYAQGAGKPCWTGPLASSTQNFGKVNVVAMDYNVTPLGSAYVRAIPSGAANTPSTVQWDAGANLITVDAPALTQTTGPSHLVRIWDVALEAGHVYRVETSAQSTVGGAVPKCRAMLFANPAGDAGYAAGRTEAALETSTSAPYAAPATGRYGVAVVNDNGAVGEFTIRVVEADVVGVPELPGGAGAGTLVTRLEALRPNPVVAGAAAHVEFELARPASVAFELVDVAGRVRARTAPAAYGAGPAMSTWAWGASDAGQRSAGIYFLRMIVDGRPAGAMRVVKLKG
jgi:hypothetical protein